jgi:large subunit ribosomal protein L10
VDRTEKASLVEELQGSFAGSPHAILTNFTGLSGNQTSDLRQRIRRAGGRYKVVKNRLAKRAAAGTAAEPLAPRFTGPCALATHPNDPVALAKAVTEFLKDNPELKVIAGVVDAREVLDPQGVKRIAALPGIREIRAQILALIQTPATTLVRLLGTPGTQIARVLDARAQKSEESAGGDPA